MRPNEDLLSDVQDELSWDPKLDAARIAASADDGKVTLRGTVGSLREKREAKTVAERVWGVVAVDNQLDVRLLDDQKREDAALRADVLQALMLNSLVPSTIDARVDGGYVTLTGTADRQYQRAEAERVASSVVGTVDLFDEVELLYPAADPDQVKHAIKQAFKRSAKIDADDLQVTARGGTVSLSGAVRSWAEHDEAIAAAWAAPGVKSVEDHVDVVY